MSDAVVIIIIFFKHENRVAKTSTHFLNICSKVKQILNSNNILSQN